MVLTGLPEEGRNFARVCNARFRAQHRLDDACGQVLMGALAEQRHEDRILRQAWAMGKQESV
eukprot:1158269-Pelagomonas_calceolata.AAC.10